MIKVKSIGYQKDNVAATVEYSLENETHSFTLHAKLAQIYKMSETEIKEYITDRVDSERRNKLRDMVEAKLNTLIDVDIEEETV